MPELPTVEFCGRTVSRLVCGGNPLSGVSHVSADLDREMIDYYDMPHIQELLSECRRQGVNTLQSRGDRHQMRAYHEHLQHGGGLQWIAQTASEFASIERNIAMIAQYKPIAIYHHGTHTDNCWHEGKIDEVHDFVKAIHDQGLPAGIGTHIPEVVEYIEEKGWDTDFYMCCFYNLARGAKSAPAVDRDAYAKDSFPSEDPGRMTSVMREVRKPCIGFKIMAASRNCSTSASTGEAFRFAFGNIKASDLVVVGMFQKHKNQVKENGDLVREVLGSANVASEP